MDSMIDWNSVWKLTCLASWDGQRIARQPHHALDQGYKRIIIL